MTCQHNLAVTAQSGSCYVCAQNDAMVVGAAKRLAEIGPGRIKVSGGGGTRKDIITFVRASEDPGECEVRWIDDRGQDRVATGFDIAFNWSGWALSPAR